MFFSRVTLDSERVSAAQLGRLVKGDQYLPHQLLWELFSTGEGADRDKTRPFIYRAMDNATWPTFYLLSNDKPEDTQSYFKLDTKSFKPALRPGMRLKFDLRANPVKRSRTAEGRQQRHDVVMDLKRKQGGDTDTRELELQAALAWLSTRAEGLGFRLIDNTFNADGYRQHRIPRRGGKPIRFSSLDMRGMLEINDVESFQQALFKGVGPAKSFGCGLLLVRPA